ncbi:MAG: hypothetical protein A2X94_01670 [Bdellovibrionales bacterium GWB1_55_8]|nr:MAG: hypothetical protein A2X94_01670 [Bdellovibrionales bacterium GWB1_55_8]
MEDLDPLLRKAIKVLLLQLAARCENPSRDLEIILSDVISELYVEAQEALKDKRSHLRVVAAGGTD